MGIMDELNAVDEKLKTDLEQKRLEIEQAKQEKGKQELEQQKMKKEQEKMEKIKKLQEVLNDTDTKLDEPHLYTIEYSHGPSGGYGYEPYNPEGKDKFEIIMTKRERKIAEITGYIKKCIRSRGKLEDIISIDESTRELTEEEKMKFDSIEKKVSIIRESGETEQDCTLDLYDEEFGRLEIPTTLQNALLSSVSIKNGQVKTKTQEMEQTDEEQNPSKITLQSIKNAIRRVLGKGER